MTNVETYKRGQVEWALWRFMSHLRGAGDAPPKVFLTRIKRLLDLDRAERSNEEALAFSETAPEGQGTDVAFSAFDSFCLALALDLLDAGFKQSEVVFLIRHIRPALRRQFRSIMENPPHARQRVPAKRAPDLPSYAEGRGRWADFRVFAVIQKVEMTEVFPRLREHVAAGMPVFMEPVFCRGIEGLEVELRRMGDEYRKAMVLEMAYAAAAVRDFLKAAPITKRGRR